MSRSVINKLSDPALTFKWLQNLRLLVDAVQARGYSWTSDLIYSPRLKNPIKVIPKSKKNFDGKCRVLALYELTDTILASGFAAYLRDQIDPHLNGYCFAFRSAINGYTPTHHDAVAAIQKYMQKHSAEPNLWVAECDIQGFFDAVSHDVIRAELKRIESTFKISLDARLHAFVESFLSGYSYTSFAVPRAHEFLVSVKKVLSPQLADPIDNLAKLKISPSDYHGIPQGSSLSCIIANIVLSSADDIVCKILGENGFYARYCDDIVIIHPNKDKCQEALNAYLKRLEELKLPYHPPKDVSKYGAKFWDEKSKLPYLWADAPGYSSPWLGFVGYQIHRNGMIRVRKSSLEKELTKQRATIQKVMAQLNERIRRSAKGMIRVPGGIRKRTQLHLISFGVGIPLQNGIGVSSGPSWARGFKELGDNAEPTGIRRLDQGRVTAIKRLNRHLNYLGNKDKIRFCTVRKSEHRNQRFYGRPYSYYRKFVTPKPVEIIRFIGWDGYAEV